MTHLIEHLKLLRNAAKAQIDALDLIADDGSYTDYRAYRDANDALDHLDRAIELLTGLPSAS